MPYSFTLPGLCQQKVGVNKEGVCYPSASCKASHKPYRLAEYSYLKGNAIKSRQGQSTVITPDYTTAL